MDGAEEKNWGGERVVVGGWGWRGRRGIRGGGIRGGGASDDARGRAGSPSDDGRGGRGPHGVLEFRGVDGRDWRVERWEELRVELLGGVGVESREEGAQVMGVLHAALAAPSNRRVWMMVRRLFGVMPVALSLADDPDEWSVWSGYELCERLGLSAEQFQEELRAIRGGVRRLLGVREDGAGAEAAARRPAGREAGGPQVGIETDEEVLRKHGYTGSMFEAMEPVRVAEEGKERWEHRARRKEENLAEQRWFVGRLREMEKLFAKPMTAQLARNALLHELRMRRASVEMFRYGSGSVEYKRAVEEHDRAEDQYRSVLEQIDEVAPWFNVSGRDVSLTSSVGDIVKGVQEWNARGDKRLVDAIFTAAEVQVMLRTSKQFPEPRYRAGWVTFVNDARAGLWDPIWRSQLKQRDLKKLDEGFKAGVMAVMDEEGEEPIDLVKEEYEDLGPDEKGGGSDPPMTRMKGEREGEE